MSCKCVSAYPGRWYRARIDATYTLRGYRSADRTGWLRCRVLSFLDTAYFDDVRTDKAVTPEPGFDLVVADAAGTVVALLDTEMADGVATIDTVAVHPDHRRRGLARRLLDRASAEATARGASTIEAWTRDDPDTLAWYRAMGFTDVDHYLHVYANYYTDPAEPDRAIGDRRAGLRPIGLFLHATLDHETQLRAEFRRVHVCRRFTKPLR